MSGVLEFRALGPLVVLVDGAPAELGKGTERALVALLVLEAGETLSTDSIIDALWGEQPPSTAREMVRNCVARTRRRLGEQAILTSSTGYRLNAAPEAVDWLRFERLASEGAAALEAGDPEQALALLSQALPLWRGRPFPELDSAAARRGQVARLEDTRLHAIEDRVDAELALGRSGTLVAELEQLVQEHPYQERLRRQLMLALYRCGRQKDALDRYQTGRQMLVEELGLEPGSEIQQLHLSILRHDPSLEATSRQDATAPRPITVSPTGRNRRVWLTVAAVTVGAGAALTIALLAERPGPTALSGRSLAVLDPRSGAPVSSLKLDRSPGPLAVTLGSIWIGAAVWRSVTAIDAHRLRTLRTVPLTAPPYALAANDNMLWAANGFNGTLTRVDARGRASGPFRPEPNATGRLALAYGFGSLWVGSQDGVLSRLDPHSAHTIAVVRNINKPEAITVGADSVWIAEAARDGILRVDPRTNRVTREISIGGHATGIAVGDGAVWAATPAEGRIWRVDPGNNAVIASIEVGGAPTHIVATNGSIWVATPDGTLSKINPATNRVDRTIALNRPVAALASESNRILVTLS
jgi:DNA-binding SARP family transcriptional activator/streptogramin lyase